MKLRPTKPTVTIVCGGSCSIVSHLPAALPSDVMVAVDVVGELDERVVASEVVQIELGRGETTASIAASSGSSRVNRLRERFGNAGGDTGCGASPAIGACALAVRRNHPQYQATVRQIEGRLLVRREERVSNVVVNSFGGASGGTGPATARVVGLDICHSFTGRGIQVHHHVVRVGPLSYEGLRTDHRSAANAAATLAMDLYQLLGVERKHSLLTEELTVCELPPFRGDQRARDKHAVALLRALSCDEVAENCRGHKSNDLIGNDLGRINLVRGSFYGEIPAHEICECAAQAYAPPLIALFKSQHSGGVVRRLRLRAEKSRAKNGVSLGAVLRLVTSTGCPASDIVAAAATSDLNFEADGLANIGADTRLRLSRLGVYLAKPMQTFSAARERKQLLLGLFAELAKHEKELVGRTRSAEQLLSVCSGKLAVHLAWAWRPNNLLQWVVASTRYVRAKRRTLRRRVLAVRRAARLLAHERALLGFVRGLKRLVVRSLQDLNNELRRVIKILSDYQPAAPRPMHSWPVEVAEIDAAMPTLFQLSLGADSQNEESLSQLARSVTLVGLQRIFGGQDATAANVAAAIATSEPKLIGPDWANGLVEYRRSIVVCPPVVHKLRQVLLEACGENASRLFFCDTCVGGVVAVRLDFATPPPISAGGLTLVAPPSLREAFLATLAEPDAFYVDGDPAPDWFAAMLGIEAPHGHGLPQNGHASGKS